MNRIAYGWETPYDQALSCLSQLARNAIVEGLPQSGKTRLLKDLLPEALGERCGCSFNDLPYHAFYVPLQNEWPTCNVVLSEEELDFRKDDFFNTRSHKLMTRRHAQNAIASEVFISFLSSVQEHDLADRLPQDKKEDLGWACYGMDLFEKNEVLPEKTSSLIEKALNHLKTTKAFSLAQMALFKDDPYKLKIPSCDLRWPSLGDGFASFTKTFTQAGLLPRANLALLDDGHLLNHASTQALNDGIGARFPFLSFCVTTLPKAYTSYKTANMNRMDAVHDYQEIYLTPS